MHEAPRPSRRRFPTKTRIAPLLFCTTLLALAPQTAAAASLRPSRSALLRQVSAAEEHGFDYVQTGSEIARLVARGLLVRLDGNDDYAVKEDHPYPYARPEVKTFIERLAVSYHRECREELMVTSLLRPKDDQPRNASSMSVHPTGMAMDLRRSWSSRCRAWLESVLLHLEEQGVVEAAKEARPPHYHVVVFPQAFRSYLAGRPGHDGLRDAEPGTYRVRRGDTLWKIAHRVGTTVEALQRINRLRSTALRVGQLLTVPEG